MLFGAAERKAGMPSTFVTQLGPDSMGSSQGHPPPTTLEQGINDVPELPFTDFERKWAASNVKLRLAVILLSVVNVAESIALWAAPVNIIEPALTLPLASIGILWNGTELFLKWRRGEKRNSLKPKSHVAVYCILWLAGSASTAYVTKNSIVDGKDDDLDKPTSVWFGLLYCICAILALVSVLHFVLFVRHCLEMERQKQDRRLQQMVIALNDQQRHRPQTQENETWGASMHTVSPISLVPPSHKQFELAELGMREPQELDYSTKPPVQPVELP